MDYILAIDQGTTGTTVVLMDTQLQRVAEASMDFEQHFPKPGWVEHDLGDIWTTVVHGVRAVTQHIDPRKIAAIGITNQRETICFWDRESTEPLARAIVWQDRRTAEQCECGLEAKGTEPFFQDKTGLAARSLLLGHQGRFSGRSKTGTTSRRPTSGRRKTRGR